MSACASGCPNIAWAFGQPGLSLLRRCVLTQIAECANAEGVAWPSFGFIAKKLGITTRAVLNAVNHLLTTPLLKRVIGQERDIMLARGGARPTVRANMYQIVRDDSERRSPSEPRDSERRSPSIEPVIANDVPFDSERRSPESLIESPIDARACTRASEASDDCEGKDEPIADCGVMFQPASEADVEFEREIRARFEAANHDAGFWPKCLRAEFAKREAAQAAPTVQPAPPPKQAKPIDRYAKHGNPFIERANAMGVANPAGKWEVSGCDVRLVTQDACEALGLDFLATRLKSQQCVAELMAQGIKADWIVEGARDRRMNGGRIENIDTIESFAIFRRNIRNFATTKRGWSPKVAAVA